MVVEAFELTGADFLAAGIGNGGMDGCGACGTDVGGEAIFCAAFNAHSAEAGVVKLVAGLVDADAEIVRVGGVERIFGVDAEFAFVDVEAVAAEAQNLVPAGERLLKFEGAVLHEFGIEAAVGREVDVLKENAVHVGRDGRAGVGGIDGNDDWGLRFLAQEAGGNKREDEERGAGWEAHKLRPMLRLSSGGVY